MIMLSIRIHKGTHNEASLRKNALTLHCNLQYYFAFVRALGPRRLEKHEAEEPDMLLHGAMASCKNLLLAKVWCARCCFYRVLANIFSLSRRLLFRCTKSRRFGPNFFRCCFVMQPTQFSGYYANRHFSKCPFRCSFGPFRYFSFVSTTKHLQCNLQHLARASQKPRIGEIVHRKNLKSGGVSTFFDDNSIP